MAKVTSDPTERMRLELNAAVITAARYIKAMRYYIQDEPDGTRKLRADKLIEGLENIHRKYWKAEDVLR